MSRPLHFDVLDKPGIGPLLTGRWTRSLLQGFLLLITLLVVYDGITGPQLAPLNLATVLVWIHYRGGTIVLLALAGNIFCMACPFTLVRTLLPTIARKGPNWPKSLRHKWGAIALFLLILWLYEAFDLWASPRRTVWLVLFFFIAASVLEITFSSSPFCKYLCPLGLFNTLYATLASLQITCRDRRLCRTCQGKPCVNGSESVPGCGTLLYVPQIKSNLDCVLCLDCARACPHDNVGWAWRDFAAELNNGTWRARWDLYFLSIMLCFAGLTNAFGMVPPIYRLYSWMEAALKLGEIPANFLISLVGNVILPISFGIGVPVIHQRIARTAEPLRHTAARHAPIFVPIGLAIWLGHYLYHFLTGALVLVPVMQNFLLDHGIAILGESPRWSLGPIFPASWLPPLQMILIIIGLFISYRTLSKINSRVGSPPMATLPWMILLLVLGLTAMILFTLPMEMRGTVSFTH